MSKLHIPELEKLIINHFYCGYCGCKFPGCSIDKVIIANKQYIIRGYYDWGQGPYRTIEIENKGITNKGIFYINGDIESFIYNLIGDIPELKERKIAIEIEKIKTIMLGLTEMGIGEYERSQIALDLSECVAKLLKPETKLQRLLSFFKQKGK